jgi:DNA-3-methyladenine glycosylase II
MIQQFTSNNYKSICDQLASSDPELQKIIDTHGYPPFWSRPNSFESLVHIILEQQVSLASALSALNKLRERVQELTPARILLLTDEEMRACYVSRQKSSYVRYLAEALLSGQLKRTKRNWQLDSGCLPDVCPATRRYFSYR